MARVRRGAAEWVELIDRWQASGLSLSAFCHEYGLNFGTMQGWAYKSTHKDALEKARREAGAVADPVEASPVAEAFLPVLVAEGPRASPPTHRAGVEVMLGLGRRVGLEIGFDAETLRRVLAVLEGRSC
jgi:hypothetical protein